ncbi:Eco57I restriction-modification methylase domain-containing protein [Frankia sp. CiP3]|uniref:Eco57I restriction-modification methylase domain-containing protein n=1 Tax=Frankia sp. CiP3 TaxID=2880971 RepID=UPI001EF44804|nr:Eco57I restriction-modification methylase domain-containing protein [Frankia sp. CiP3]
MVSQGLFDELSSLPLTESLQPVIEHGEVFTRRWIVELILDWVGYTPDKDLTSAVIVEPACGGGAFIGPIVERLIASCQVHGRSPLDAADAVCSFDLLDRNVRSSRDLTIRLMTENGWDMPDAGKLAGKWIRQGDFLLQGAYGGADFVVGNPPYIRLEDVPEARMKAYRSSCPTMGGRADVYVGFYEVGLRILRPGGRLGFICADRWMRNQYGSRLRELVSCSFNVEAVLTMHDVDAFFEQVSAYPAITIIQSAPQGTSVVADTTSSFGADEAILLRRWAGRERNEETSIRTPTFHAARLPHWFAGTDSWPAASPARLAILEDLNDRFPCLEDGSTGTRVGIGVATGADSVFITAEPERVDVEDDRLLPLAMVRDITGGSFSWTGTHLVNPWGADGQLVDFACYPRLGRYFRRHSGQLRARHIARKQPARWYKTIDKVDHQLIKRPKLLFPDMKANIHPVLDPGGCYPHHNLYYVVSDTWDLRVLGGLLLSRVAEAFIVAYAVKMRGGTLRFQAQYLRRIRVPHPDTISETDTVALRDAFEHRDVDAATDAALRVFNLANLPD